MKELTLSDVLRAQKQCDETGDLCIVSRQAADEAADVIERLTAENLRLAGEVSNRNQRARLDGDKAVRAFNSLYEISEKNRVERDAYQVAADKMAGEHKVERDALSVQIDALAKDAVLMRVFITMVSKQKPEKPDYWCSCGQCERNISEAEDIVDAIAKESKHDK